MTIRDNSARLPECYIVGYEQKLDSPIAYSLPTTRKWGSGVSILIVHPVLEVFDKDGSYN